MELPTYTSIWRIEKRLYKLYDFRLPMPVPVGQVAAFLAIAIPYMLILTMAGMPFSHTWVWLYVLPPGVLAWLVTRPVLEGKRLPELVVSQLRYLSEPRTWCRMAPLAEKDQMYVTATVWRRGVVSARGGTGGVYATGAIGTAAATTASGASVSGVSVGGVLVGAVSVSAVSASAATATGAHAEVAETEPAALARPGWPARPVWPAKPAMGSRSSATPSRQTADPAGQTTDPTGQTTDPTRQTAEPTRQRAEPTRQTAEPTRQRAEPTRQRAEPTDAAPAQQHAREQARVPERATSATAAQSAPAPAQQRAREQARMPERATSATAAQSAPAPGRPDGRPHITVRTTADPGRQLPVVERALRTSPVIQGDGWHERVVMVPGGHRPGKPDQLQRDQARARFPLPGPARIVVLGCTAGAGQTTTTLLTGQLLATLRGEAVAVLDIGSGAGSLTEQARQIPRLLPGHRDLDSAAPESGRERGLQVVTADPPAEQPADAGNLIDAVVARYRITIADPAAVHVPRAVHVADQLVLVAPASHDAAGSLAMTLEWLEAHGHADLARNSVTVLNGVSTATAAHVERAAGVATGRCRAIVRVPWDGGLANGRALGPAAVHAFTALAGVLISGLADPANARGAADPAHAHGPRAESGQR